MIYLKNVFAQYNREKEALKNFSLKINDGEFVFIVGKTGAGKTTLFRLLTKEINQTAGTIKVFNHDLEKLKYREVPYYRRNLGIIFQDFRLLNDKNVFENVAFVQEVIGINYLKIKKRVNKILSLVGIRNKAKKYPDELSGGEKQKVAIARAIINKPKIVLADEPTGNLDEESSNEIINLLDMINKNGTTVIIITHDIHMVARMNKRVIRISGGEIISDTIGLDEELDTYIKEERV